MLSAAWLQPNRCSNGQQQNNISKDKNEQIWVVPGTLFFFFFAWFRCPESVLDVYMGCSPKSYFKAHALWVSVEVTRPQGPSGDFSAVHSCTKNNRIDIHFGISITLLVPLEANWVHRAGAQSTVLSAGFIKLTTQCGGITPILKMGWNLDVHWERATELPNCKHNETKLSLTLIWLRWREDNHEDTCQIESNSCEQSQTRSWQNLLQHRCILWSQCYVNYKSFLRSVGPFHQTNRNKNIHKCFLSSKYKFHKELLCGKLVTATMPNGVVCRTASKCQKFTIFIGRILFGKLDSFICLLAGSQLSNKRNEPNFEINWPEILQMQRIHGWRLFFQSARGRRV